MVLFESTAYRAKPLNKVSKVDMEAIKSHILEIEEIGGTNFEAGYSEALKLFEEYKDIDPNEYENRIIVVTDAMPNEGTNSNKSILNMIKDASDENIYTTFIGVGLDFNTEVVKTITDVKGANYYAVKTEEDFKARMGDEFEYMVTPLVFDLDMSLESENFEIEKIYGTDSLSSEKNNIMHVNTLFPSKSNSSGEVKGGVILLKLKLKDKDLPDKVENQYDEKGKVTIKVSYETRDGKKDTTEKSKVFDLTRTIYFGGGGIEKAILLSRYVNVVKDWITYERSKDDRYLIKVPIGIIDWFEEPEEEINVFTADANTIYNYYFSENERISVPLTLGPEYREIFKMFKDHLEKEIENVGDEDLKQEIEVLDKILAAPEKPEAERDNDYPDGEY
jgi:Ca-activated chloride channel family protein